MLTRSLSLSVDMHSHVQGLVSPVILNWDNWVLLCARLQDRRESIAWESHVLERVRVQWTPCLSPSSKRGAQMADVVENGRWGGFRAASSSTLRGSSSNWKLWRITNRAPLGDEKPKLVVAVFMMLSCVGVASIVNGNVQLVGDLRPDCCCHWRRELVPDQAREPLPHSLQLRRGPCLCNMHGLHGREGELAGYFYYYFHARKW